MFIKIQASITFASEIGHQSKFMARKCLDNSRRHNALKAEPC